MKQKEHDILKEKEKARTYLHPIQFGKGVKNLQTRIHPYANKKISERKYVELWYLLPQAAKRPRTVYEAAQTTWTYL